MTDLTTLFALVAAAAGLGVVHTLAPDHWIPVAAVARARSLGRGATARLALLCGAVHVAVSALLAVAGVLWGRELLVAAGLQLETAAAALLVVLGLTWLAIGIHRALLRRVDPADEDRSGVWSLAGLLAFFGANPCVPLVPLAASAALLGPAELAAVVGVYAIGTIGTLTALALPARIGFGFVGDRWAHAGAGAATLGVALLVLMLGI